MQLVTRIYCISMLEGGAGVEEVRDRYNWDILYQYIEREFEEMMGSYNRGMLYWCTGRGGG